MKEKRREAIATIIISGHEETVLLRPVDQLLTMTVLYYDNQIKKASDFVDEIGNSKISAQELRLAETLVEASSTKKAALSRYKDHYAERTREIIDAKLAGKQIRHVRAAKGPRVVNLMDALRKSLSQKKRRQTADAPRRSAGRQKTRKAKV